jgi:hypothetical protein
MSLPQDAVEEQMLREHVERAKSYKGPLAAYCREQNIDYDKFMYFRWRHTGGPAAKVAAKAAAQAVVAKTKSPIAEQSGFAQVVSAQQPPMKAKASAKALPDPQWLAELIHNLVER